MYQMLMGYHHYNPVLIGRLPQALWEPNYYYYYYYYFSRKCLEARSILRSDCFYFCINNHPAASQHTAETIQA
jgi:hypothetical protein